MLAKYLIFSLRVRERSRQDFGLLNRAYHQSVWVLLSSFHVAEGNSILIGFSFGLGSSIIRYPLAQKSDDELYAGNQVEKTRKLMVEVKGR